MDTACASSTCPKYGDCDANDPASLALGKCMLASCGAIFSYSEDPPTEISDDCNLPPSTWTCSSESYDSFDKGYANPICNCNCGASDPDCAKVTTNDCPSNAPVCSPCGCLPMGQACQ